MSLIISDLSSFNGGYNKIQIAAKMETDFELSKQFTILIKEKTRRDKKKALINCAAVNKSVPALLTNAMSNE